MGRQRSGRAPRFSETPTVSNHDDSLTRRVRATLTIELEYDLDSRVSTDRLKTAVNKIAGDASARGLFLPADIGHETSVASWTSKVAVYDSQSASRPASHDGEVGIVVSTDNGKTFTPAPEGVRLIYRGLSVWDDEDDTDAPETTADLAFTFTHEGVITDLWLPPVEGERELSHLEATDSATIDEIVAKLS